MNLLSSATGYLISRILNKKYPLTVGIQITNRCNLRCSYCDYTSNSSENELTYDEWVSVIDEMSRAGVRAISISGGEPMVRDDIANIIAYAKKKKLYVLLCSNGFRIKENVEALKGVDNIGISLDGDSASHDAIRGKGAHKTALEAIDACRRNNIKVTHGAVITKINMNDIDYLLSFTKAHGTFAAFQTLHYNYTCENLVSKNWKGSKEIKDICLSPEEIKKVFRYIADKKRSKFRIANSMAYLMAVAQWPNYPMLYHKDIYKGIRCFAGRNYCFIYPDGSLFPCNMFHGQKCNVIAGGFISAFSKLQKKKECNACILPCHLERNILFSIRMDSLFTWYKTVLKNDR